MKSSSDNSSVSSEGNKESAKTRSRKNKSRHKTATKGKRLITTATSKNSPKSFHQNTLLAKKVDSTPHPVLEARVIEISEAHAEFFHSVRCQWLTADWESLADLQESEFSSHPKRAKIAILVASAMHELRAYDSAREALYRALEWGASRRDIVKVLIGHTHAALGRACLAEEDIPRAEKHFFDCISNILPSKSAKHHAKERLFKEILSMGLLPDAQKLLASTLSDFQARNVGTVSEQSVFATKLELLGHELQLALQRGQIGIHGNTERIHGKTGGDTNTFKDELKSKSTSQLGQDLWVLEKTSYKRNGFFVEFGATDGVRLNNTYLLEKEFDWSGLCAEPNPEFFAKLQKNRSCMVSQDCISGESGKEVSFLLADEYGGISDFCDDMHNQKRKAYDELDKSISVTTISLDDFLSKHGAPTTIDYLSIDTEGSEYEILRHFPFKKWNVRLITVEHNFTPMRELIHELLTSKGYSRQEAKWDDWYELKQQEQTHA
jgi:FkbM family methyltransferase